MFITPFMHDFFIGLRTQNERVYLTVEDDFAHGDDCHVT